jgi:Cd2+/Zn2+-exporting ATPase
MNAPMHCAICADELEREGESQSLWRRREAIFTGISGALLALGLVLSLLTLDPTLLVLFGRTFALSTVLYLASVFFGAYHFARKGLYALKTLSLGINFLMSLAILGAIVIEEYVEAASLAFLFSLAELLEEFSVERARRSLRELIKLAPREARVRRNGEELLCPIEEIAVGEVCIVKPGERIALDGQVLSGSSFVNQAPITGESVPVEKRPGDEVFAGTINYDGYLEITVTKRAKDTTLARIIHLVEEAEAQKAPSERFVDRFARYYTPGVVLVALLVATVPAIFFGAAFSEWFSRALALLVIACPCALLISTPVSIISAITSAARHGVLIKGGVYLEELGQIQTIVFDKTGTLTTGQLTVTDIIPTDSISPTEVLRIAAALERKSQHPIAQAIVRAYEERAAGEPLPDAQEFTSLTGQGVQAKLDGTLYRVGRLQLFNADGLALASQAKTVIGVGTPDRLLGLIALADSIRPQAHQTVQRLKDLGIEVVMVTGDNEATARAVAQQLGITHYHAGAFPEQKVHEIEHLRSEVRPCGDGRRRSQRRAGPRCCFCGDRDGRGGLRCGPRDGPRRAHGG